MSSSSSLFCSQPCCQNRRTSKQVWLDHFEMLTLLRTPNIGMRQSINHLNAESVLGSSTDPSDQVLRQLAQPDPKGSVLLASRALGSTVSLCSGRHSPFQLGKKPPEIACKGRHGRCPQLQLVVTDRHECACTRPVWKNAIEPQERHQSCITSAGSHPASTC